MEQAGRVYDQVIRRFGCQFGGGAGNRFGTFKVQLGHGMAPYRTNPGAARILPQVFAKRRAEGAAGADHQRAIAVVEGGHGHDVVHWLTPAP